MVASAPFNAEDALAGGERFDRLRCPALQKLRPANDPTLASTPVPSGKKQG